MAIPNAAEAYRFTMGFVASSDRFKGQFLDRQREVLANFMVDPQYADVGSTTSPYRYGRVYGSPKRQVILKDPETHKTIMVYASKLVRALFGSREREYIKARPRGTEDAPDKAPTVSRLLRYDFALPGTFRTFVEAIIDMLLFGTSIIEVSWEYCEREMPVRTVTSEMGVDLDEWSRLRIPVYDDVRMTPVDVVDFYPDPARYRIEDMAGAAKRFRMTALEARKTAASGIYDPAAVENAVQALSTSTTQPAPGKYSFRSGIDQPSDRAGISEFKDMIGYEYWGDVPWIDDYGSARRVITILNNVVVRNDPWPLADPHLPWHTLIINPVQGRFYGISPAEVIRYDQDFADAIKMLLAEAIVRQVKPPIAYDPEMTDVDSDRLNVWGRADRPIPIRGGPNSIGTLRYDANIQAGFQMLGGLKASMEQASGASGGISGEAGPDREAASVGVQRINMALDRPELAAMVLENECLPPIGEALLRRNQQFLDTAGLIQRVGEQPASVWIGTIMGDFDVEFVGSRMALSRQEKLQSLDRLTAMASAVPPLQAVIPWMDIATYMVDDLLQLPEIAAKMPDPATLMANMQMMQTLGPGASNGNGAPTAPEPSGLLPAQAAGGMNEPE
jgi:hypothetical protein